MSSSRRLPASKSDCSASNCPACVIADSGLRISCAMLADSRPSAASFICWACARSAPASSSMISVGACSPQPRRVKRGNNSRPAGPAIASVALDGALPLRQSSSAPCSTGNTPSSRSEEHTSELQSLMRISYAVFCLKKKQHTHIINNTNDKHQNQQLQDNNSHNKA